MEIKKARLFNGPQIHQLIRDPELKNLMNESATGSVGDTCSGSEESS